MSYDFAVGAIESFLQINLYLSDAQLQCWNISQFLEGLGVTKAVFFVVSFKPRGSICYEGCTCVSHMKNVEAQLNIYDLSYEKHREKGIDISRVLSSIGIHHIMRDVPIVKSENLIVNLQHNVTLSDTNEEELRKPSSPVHYFRTSTPIPESLPSIDGMRTWEDNKCLVKAEEQLKETQTSYVSQSISQQNHLSPEDLLEIQKCCEHMVDMVSAQENSSFRSVDDLNLSGFFSFGNSLCISRELNPIIESNSLLGMTGFTSVLENFKKKSENCAQSTSTQLSLPVVEPVVVRSEPSEYDQFADGLRNGKTFERYNHPSMSDSLYSDQHESAYSGNQWELNELERRRSAQNSSTPYGNPYEKEHTNYRGDFRGQNRNAQKRPAPSVTSTYSNDSNASYDEVFIRRRYTRGKSLEIKGRKMVVVNCNFTDCHHVVVAPRNDLKRILLDHVEEHIEKAVPCPTTKCPCYERSFLDVREHLRSFHAFDSNCIEAILKRASKRRMRELTLKCFPTKFF